MQNSLLVFGVLAVVSMLAITIAIVRSKLQQNAYGPGKVFAAGVNGVLIVVIGFYLYQQSTALDRLHGIGIKTPAKIGHVVGMANGTGAKPLWVFKYSGSESDLIAFYAAEKHRPGWSIMGVQNGRILLRQAPVDLKIRIAPDTVTFLLTESQ